MRYVLLYIKIHGREKIKEFINSESCRYIILKKNNVIFDDMMHKIATFGRNYNLINL